MSKVALPTTFRAKNKRGEWVELDFRLEPIVQTAVQIATNMYHAGSGSAFGNLATRSAIVGAVNNALNAGNSIDGAILSGPALIGIPAEVYMPERRSFWRGLFR